MGNIPSYMCEKHKLNKQGTAQGVLHGGNMAVAYGLRGTPYDIPAEGTILFIEDVSERPHAIERMMYNLKLGGVLEKLSGLIIGQFTEYEEDRSLGKELYAALADLEAGGFLKEIEPLKHEVGTCYRCHSTIEPMVSKQWFVKMEPLAKPAIL